MTRGRFDVWAPRPTNVRLSVGDDVVPMRRGDDGWWTPDGPVPDGEVDYGYLLDDVRPPRCRTRGRGASPHGVHERSRTFDPTTYDWTDGAWTGRQLAGAVIYELHIGTFTPEGTFDAALGKLDHLRSIGVDFVEVMPVNAFNGTHNWGYDGVLWSAVHEQYGGPAGYQRFVDGCHAAGLGVIQDVVTTTSVRPATTCRCSGRTSSPARTPGATWSTSTATAATRCGAYILDNVRDVARRDCTSTGCGSTRCTRSTTPPRCTCWRRWRSRSPRCPPTCADRSR